MLTRHEKINQINALSARIGDMVRGLLPFDPAEKDRLQAEINRLWQVPHIP